MSNHGLGCIPSLKDLRDYIFDKKAVCAVEYPESFSLDNLPRIKNQKTVGSCVAHSMSSILEYHSSAKLSTNFIYGIRNKLYNSTGKGMSLKHALKTVYKYGDMLETDCPGNTEVDEVFDIANEAFADETKLETASNYTIEGYTKLKSDDDIKYALMNHGPVFASIKWYKTYTIDKSTGLLTFDKSSEQSYHAIMVYGWNEQGWLIQNSWGSSWGKSGKFICADDFNEAYSVIETGNEKKDVVDPTNGSNVIELIFKLINIIINLVKKN